MAGLGFIGRLFTRKAVEAATKETIKETVETAAQKGIQNLTINIGKEEAKKGLVRTAAEALAKRPIITTATGVIGTKIAYEAYQRKDNPAASHTPAGSAIEGAVEGVAGVFKKTFSFMGDIPFGLGTLLGGIGLAVIGFFTGGAGLALGLGALGVLGGQALFDKVSSGMSTPQSDTVSAAGTGTQTVAAQNEEKKPEEKKVAVSDATLKNLAQESGEKLAAANVKDAGAALSSPVTPARPKDSSPGKPAPQSLA